MTIVITPCPWIALAVSGAAVGVVCLCTPDAADRRVTASRHTCGTRRLVPPGPSADRVRATKRPRNRLLLPPDRLHSP